MLTILVWEENERIWKPKAPMLLSEAVKEARRLRALGFKTKFDKVKS
jgi:hypothetical protein